jgi:prevent-host-death family protein
MGMPEIGLRELKIRASEVVRNVWKRRARYIITYRGRSVGQLIPLQSSDREEVATETKNPAKAWDELSGSDSIYGAVALRFGATLVSRDREQLERLERIVPCRHPQRMIRELERSAAT